jgi:hypothetical protein
MNLTRLITYHEIAAHWQVSLRSVRRWVLALETQGIIEPLRPTMNTIRLTVADYRTLESNHSRRKCRTPDRTPDRTDMSNVRLKSRQKRTRRESRQVLPSAAKTSLSVLDSN